MRRGRTETPTRRNRQPDHPRFAWIDVPVRIAVQGDRLADFQGQIIGFDRSWVKVRLDGKKPRLREGTNIGLQLGPTGHEATLPLQGIVWRVDPNGILTVLLSLSTQEFQRLKNLAGRVAEERAMPLKPPPPRSWLDRRPQTGARSRWAPPAPPEEVPRPSSEASEESAEAGGEPDSPSTEPAEPAEASAEVAGSPPVAEEAAKAEPVEPPPESQQPSPVRQAATWARLFLEGLRAQPVNLSLWCALGATMYRLGKKKAASEILQHVVSHRRADSREVRLASSWLERLGAVAEEAAQGDDRDAARLYYKAFGETFQAAPGDLLLWYAMGLALSHMGRRGEAAEAFRHVVGHGPPDSREVRLAQLWLERGEVSADPTRVVPPRVHPAADPAERPETRPVEVRQEPSGRAPVLQDEFGYFKAALQSSRRELPAVPPQPRAKRASAVEATEGRAKPAAPAPGPRGGVRVAGAARRGRAGPGPAEQAALLASHGNYAEAAKLYAEALRETPENGSLWYALGVSLRHLNRPQEAAEALQRVIRHGEPESLVRLARLWLERGGVGSEGAAGAEDTGGTSPRKGRPRRGEPDRGGV